MDLAWTIQQSYSVRTHLARYSTVMDLKKINLTDGEWWWHNIKLYFIAHDSSKIELNSLMSKRNVVISHWFYGG